MSETELPESAPLFPSISELRAAHRALMRLHHTERLDAAIVEDFVERARATGTLLYADSDRDSAQAVLDYWTAALYRSDRDIVNAVLEPFDEQRARKDAKCPYVGLAPFSEDDSDRFFGRDSVVKLLQYRLTTERLLILIGQSGTGKSSIIRAGLLPRLHGGTVEGSESWRYFDPIVPGSEPVETLARMLRPKDTVLQSGWVADEAKALRASGKRLHEKLSGSQPALIVVDQFEELFTLCADVADRRAFVANLLYLASAPGLRHTVIITVRSDFEPHLMKVPELESVVRRAEVRISTLNAAELRDAIERPAAMVALQIEEALIDRMIEDVRGEPAALPLLQFTLRTLWEKRDQRNRITMEAYDLLGGAMGALSTRADELYKRLLPQQQIVVRRIFLRMTRPAAAAEKIMGRPAAGGLEPMSRRIRKDDVLVGEVLATAEPLLDRFIAAGLIRLTAGDTPADAQVEVAHEALLRNWETLQKWIDQERVQIILRDRFETAAQEWHENGRHAGFLDAVQLADAERWQQEAEARAFGVSERVAEFIAASQRHIRRRKRIASAVVTAALMLVILFGVSVYFTMQEKTRRAEAEAALASQQRVEAERKLNESKRDQARLQAFLSSTDEQKLQILRERIVEPLKRENDQLKAKISQMQAAAAVLPPNQDAEVASLRAQLAALQTDRDGLRAGHESLNKLLAQRQLEIEQFRAQLASLPQTPTYPPLTGKKLSINDVVMTTAADAKPASICCFVKNHGMRYFITSSRVLRGEPGDLVVHRRDDGTLARVGIYWGQFGTDNAAAVVQLLPEIGTEKKLPKLAPNADRKRFNPAWALTSVDEPLIVVDDPPIKARVAARDSKTVTLAIPLTDAYLGRAVIDDDRFLIGFVSAIAEDRVTVTRAYPILYDNGWQLDD